MTNIDAEWNQLQAYLNVGSSAPVCKNQFFQQLIAVLTDPRADKGDLLLAIRGALLAIGADEPRKLFFGFVDFGSKIGAVSKSEFLAFGLEFDRITGSICTLFDKLGIQDLGLVYTLEPRRKITSLPLDQEVNLAFGAKSKLSSYRGLGQRESIRKALQSPRGSTVLINLPTGTGKTLVAYCLSLLGGNKGLTLVIVPTVALALEQGSRVKQFFNSVEAYEHNGPYYFAQSLSDDDRAKVKERIRNGQQRVLFTSPESARGALLPSLFDAVSKGLLSNIIFDEAHIIDQWGDEFRPDFQVFACLARSLMRASKSPIRTVLLSATFSEQSLNTLSKLFLRSDLRMLEVHASFLRPEPQYQIIRCTEDNRDGLFFDAVVELPKPMIVYCRDPSVAQRLLKFLRSKGIHRSKCFHGKTKSNDREEIITKWASGALDIVVATSAFGVGMDKGDVRSILHYQAPENLDRFYQDVGRSGRDGKACQSLLFYERVDLEKAKSLNDSKLISIDLGFERWKRMFDSAKKSGDNYTIGLKSRHSGIRYGSDENEKWNLRTLLLMLRSGMIDLHFTKPSPPIGIADDDAEHRKYYEDYYSSIEVEVLVDGHLDKAVWGRYVDPARSLEYQGKGAAFAKFKSWVLHSKTKHLCAELKQYYTIDGHSPQKACGGCPACIESGKVKRHRPVGSDVDIVGLEYKLDQCRYAYYGVQLSEQDLAGKLENTIIKLIKQGLVKHIVASIGLTEFIFRALKQVPEYVSNTVISDNDSRIKVLSDSLVVLSPSITVMPSIEFEAFCDPLDSNYFLLASEGMVLSGQHKMWTHESKFIEAKSLDSFTASI